MPHNIHHSFWFLASGPLCFMIAIFWEFSSKFEPQRKEIYLSGKIDLLLLTPGRGSDFGAELI